MPEALRSALASRPRVEAEAGKPVGVRGALLVPLGPSPFHRLLLHALCQYRRLHSRSESKLPSWAAFSPPFVCLLFLLLSDGFVVLFRLVHDSGYTSSTYDGILRFPPLYCEKVAGLHKFAPLFLASLYLLSFCVAPVSRCSSFVLWRCPVFASAPSTV